MELFEKVKKQLAECIADNTEEIVCEDGDNYFGLPKPYSVPTPGKTFREMYYWDSYFTNVGFLSVENVEQAKNNVENILHLIDRFGFMPNGSRTRYLYHSQPPFFSQMVKEIYEIDKDREFLARAYKAMKKEHSFWIENRSFENGLLHYGFLAEDKNLQETRKDKWKIRTGLEPSSNIRENVGNFIGYCESGWDCNPRWGDRSFAYACPDLNALIWNLEQCLAEFASILNNGEQDAWQMLADKRKSLVNLLLWEKDRGVFSDRNIETGDFGKVFSAAAFYPLYFKMATTEQASSTVKKLYLLERAHGVVPCEEYYGDGTFQWAAPNLWPCIQWMVIKGLDNYEYKEDAMRLAKKYADVVESVEKSTGQLWEKYNANTGFTDVAAEYKMPPMMGWTAGIYLRCKQYIKDNQ